MIKKPLIPILLLCASQHAYSQRNTEDFEITLPGKKVTHSLYNEVSSLQLTS